jgi:hypothetical protein
MWLMKSKFLLPAIFIAVLAISRIPGLMPGNFSVVYAFVFCSGVYFQGSAKWWLPLGTMLVTDVALNIYYHVAPFDPQMLWNYAIYALLIGLGKWIGPKAGMLKLIMGGLLGGLLFYLIANTAAWLEDSYYAKTLAGWIQALTTGRPGYPASWEFFRNTLLSSGLFTALFAGAAKVTAESPADKTAGAHDPADSQPEAQPQEAET